MVNGMIQGRNEIRDDGLYSENDLAAVGIDHLRQVAAREAGTLPFCRVRSSAGAPPLRVYRGADVLTWLNN